MASRSLQCTRVRIRVSGVRCASPDADRIAVAAAAIVGLGPSARRVSAPQRVFSPPALIAAQGPRHDPPKPSIDSPKAACSACESDISVQYRAVDLTAADAPYTTRAPTSPPRRYPITTMSASRSRPSPLLKVPNDSRPDSAHRTVDSFPPPTAIPGQLSPTVAAHSA